MRRITIRALAAGIGISIMVSGLGTSAASAAGSRAVTSSASSVLPEPTGRFSVGVTTVPSVSPDATTRVWYPARRGTGQGAPAYLAREVAAELGMPASLVSRAVPDASVDAEPARTGRPRPVVVLMPGWGLPIALSTALVQELASHGYVVVTVDPAFGSEDPMSLPADTANPGRRLEQVAAAVDFATGGNIAAVAGPVDANKVAVGGHSIAGAVAFQASLDDARVRAAFDLDGWLHGAALETPATVPALMIDASGLEPATRAIVARTPTAVTVELWGATHSDVTDVPCLADTLGQAARTALGLGPIGCAGTSTTNEVVLRFLDVVLRDDDATPSAARLTRGLRRFVRS